MKKFSTLFLGTPDFSVPVLDLLKNHPMIDLGAVATMPDRPAGRGKHLASPEVAIYAKAHKIKLFQTDNVNTCEDFLRLAKECDLIVVLAFAQFLRQELLDMPNIGCFNIHTSLLPKYRGAAPIQSAVLNGDEYTGVSIQRMVKKMDAGDIAHSKELAISPFETGGQLYTRLKYQAVEALNEFIHKLYLGKVEFQEQDHTAASFAPTLGREDGVLNFEALSDLDIHRRVRAFFPWPGTSFFSNGKRIKVFEVELCQIELAPKEVLIKDSKIFVGCKTGAVRLKFLQVEGKKAAYDFQISNGLRGALAID